jgi:hypothetical protein
MGGREGLKEREGKERKDEKRMEGKGRGIWAPNVPDRLTPLGDTPEPPLVDRFSTCGKGAQALRIFTCTGPRAPLGPALVLIIHA